MIKTLPIYLVSLEKDTNRRAELERKFSKYYKNFIYIPAVDGRELSAKKYYEKSINYYLRNNKILSPGELGASLSHIHVLQKFIESEHDYALILEDDIIGNDSDIETVMQVMPVLQPSDFLLLGGQQGLNKRFQLGKKDTSKDLLIVSEFSKKFVTRACCYVVSKDIAKHILNYQDKHLSLADKWGDFFNNTSIKIYYKDVFKHPVDLKDSHIESERRNLDKSFFKKLFSSEGPRKIYNKIYNNFMSCFLKIIGFKEL